MHFPKLIFPQDNISQVCFLFLFEYLSKKKFYGFEKNLLEALHPKDKSDNKITRVQTK